MHIELYVRWIQEIRQFQPSTVPSLSAIAPRGEMIVSRPPWWPGLSHGAAGWRAAVP